MKKLFSVFDDQVILLARMAMSSTPSPRAIGRL